MGGSLGRGRGERGGMQWRRVRFTPWETGEELQPSTRANCRRGGIHAAESDKYICCVLHERGVDHQQVFALGPGVLDPCTRRNPIRSARVCRRSLSNPLHFASIGARIRGMQASVPFRRCRSLPTTRVDARAAHQDRRSCGLRSLPHGDFVFAHRTRFRLRSPSNGLRQLHDKDWRVGGRKSTRL